MNSNKIASSFIRSAETYLANSKVQRETAQILLALVDKYAAYMSTDDTNKATYAGTQWNKQPRHLIDLGCGPDAHLASLALHRFHWPKKSRFETIDFCSLNNNCPLIMDPLVAKIPLIINSRVEDINLWVDNMEFNEFDVAFANAALHWLSEPDQFLNKLIKLMRKGGILAMSVFGPYNLAELQQLGFPPMNYWTFNVWHNWLEAAGFEILEEGDLKFTDYFPNPMGVIEHLRSTGVNAGVKSTTWTKGKLTKFVRDYKQFEVEGRGVSLTFNPMVFVVRKRLDYVI